MTAYPKAVAWWIRRRAHRAGALLADDLRAVTYVRVVDGGTHPDGIYLNGNQLELVFELEGMERAAAMVHQLLGIGEANGDLEFELRRVNQ